MFTKTTSFTFLDPLFLQPSILPFCHFFFFFKMRNETKEWCGTAIACPHCLSFTLHEPPSQHPAPHRQFLFNCYCEVRHHINRIDTRTHCTYRAAHTITMTIPNCSVTSPKLLMFNQTFKQRQNYCSCYWFTEGSPECQGKKLDVERLLDCNHCSGHTWPYIVTISNGL